MCRVFRNFEEMLLPIKSYCYLLLIFAFSPLYASLPSRPSAPGGLKFHGLEKPIDQRTSYSVFADGAPEYTNAFGIEFKLSLYPVTEFGYLLRIKNDRSAKIYNLFHDGQGSDLIFKFNEEGTNNLIT